MACRQVEGHSQGVHVVSRFHFVYAIPLHVFERDVEIRIVFLLSELMPRGPLVDGGLETFQQRTVFLCLIAELVRRDREFTGDEVGNLSYSGIRFPVQKGVQGRLERFAPLFQAYPHIEHLRALHLCLEHILLDTLPYGIPRLGQGYEVVNNPDIFIDDIDFLVHKPELIPIFLHHTGKFELALLDLPLVRLGLFGSHFGLKVPFSPEGELLADSQDLLGHRVPAEIERISDNGILYLQHEHRVVQRLCLLDPVPEHLPACAGRLYFRVVGEGDRNKPLQVFPVLCLLGLRVPLGKNEHTRQNNEY